MRPRSRASATSTAPGRERATEARFGGQPWSPGGLPRPQRAIGALILGGIAIGCLLAARDAAGSSRMWLSGGGWLALACCAWAVADLFRATPPAPTGWRTRAPWPAEDDLPERRETRLFVGMLAVFLAFAAGACTEVVANLAAGTARGGSVVLAGFGLLALAIAGVAGYRLLQALRHEPARLRRPATGWPLRAGAAHRLVVAGPVLAIDAQPEARLLLLQERQVHRPRSGRKRSGSSLETVVDVLAETPVALEWRGATFDRLDAELRFTLPAGPVLAPTATQSVRETPVAARRGADTDDRAPVPADTDAQAERPRYWLLVLRAPQQGIDWYAEWILPVAAPGG